MEYSAWLVTRFEAGMVSVLAEQGQPGREFFVVVDGSATATRNGVELARLGSGSFFGELALLDGGNRTATVVAETDMHLLLLTRSEFKELHATAPSVAYKMLAELGVRLRRADGMFDGSAPAAVLAFQSL